MTSGDRRLVVPLGRLMPSLLLALPPLAGCQSLSRADSRYQQGLASGRRLANASSAVMS